MEKSVTIEKSGQGRRINPFPGLRPFTPDESDLFFGREGQSEEILTKLRKNRFVTVIGASGSGKSSLIYCGIIPRLIAKNSKGGTWRVLNLRPGNDPIGNLVAMFANEMKGDSEANKSDLESVFRSGDMGLEKAVAGLKMKSDEKILLMVDQFEELFRFKDTQRSGSFTGDSKQFVNLIVSALTRSKLDIHIIITMRSDFIGECAHFQGLTNLINNSNYLVPHMARENYLKAITGPIEYAGAKIDQELVDNLLEEIGSRIDQLPVLQHAMMRTWSHWERMGHKDIPVSMTDYDAVGQMHEAMSRHADEAFEELDNRGKEICEVLFKTITEKGVDNKGIRHPTKVETIASIARCTNEELYNVINVYRLAGRSFLTPGPTVELEPDTVIDVSHESLMRVWDRLAVWVEEEAASVQMYLRLSESSELFQAGKTSLWRPPDLHLAISWRDDNKPTLTWAERYNPAFERAMVYLQTSEKEYMAEEENKIKAQKRQLRRSRITAMILGTAAIISVMFMLYAFVQQIEAERNKNEAVKNKELADLNALDAKAQADTAQIQRNLAIAASLEARAQADTAEYNAAVADTQRLRAETNEERAEREAIRAQQEAERAIASEKIAREQEAEARRQEEIATRRKMVAVGKRMAVKSMQGFGGDLQGLLAYQAYNFNKRNGGKDNDSDIYMGLYSFSKTYGGANYRQLEGHTGAVNSISFVEGQNVFFTSGSDGKVIKRNLNGGQPVVIFEGNEQMDIITTSPDGNLLACGSDNSMIRVFPVSGSGISFNLSGHTSKINSLAFTPDSKYLYSSSLDGTIRKWDMESKQSTVLKDNTGTFASLDISKDGKYLAGGTEAGDVFLWNIQTSSEPETLNSGKGKIEVVRFDEEGVLAVGYQSGEIELWNVESATVTAEITAHGARVNDITFNTRSRQMATGGADGFIKLWNLDDVQEPPIAIKDGGEEGIKSGFIMAVSFSSDGKLIISGADAVDELNLVVRPTHIDYMISDICQILTRNFTQSEWRIHVGEDIEYEVTCDAKDISIKVQEKKNN